MPIGWVLEREGTIALPWMMRSISKVKHNFIDLTFDKHLLLARIEWSKYRVSDKEMETPGDIYPEPSTTPTLQRLDYE